ncbi:DUF6455 family protein [Shimia haliotis]|uniref:DUF6455 domain-containing protein n=1 Tax=Shimia haliotis TaxID=1280847 RepID=A0A1I4G760_9RHOB|nr:DUF6455 family protein [Shimia haliotis]SFL24926.1 hypothetical protein SAMN04488036_107169 [Shimia haliotis]
MPQSDTVRRHVALVDDAALRFGMDLQDAAIRGVLRVDEISEAVARCTLCSNPEACEVWLAKKSKKSGSLPAFCRNKKLFARLGGLVT